MATITDQDFTWCVGWVKNHRTYYDDIRTWGLTRPTYKDAIQAVETYMVAGFSARPATSIRAAIEAVTGATTPSRASTIFTVWAAWRIYSGGG